MTPQTRALIEAAEAINKPLFCEDPFSLICRIEAKDALHASIVALIDQTLACISGKSHADCLREIQARLAKEKAPEGT